MAATKNKRVERRLGNVDDFFDSMEGQQDVKHTESSISLDKLMQFSKHPFRLYEGERFNDMIDSIKQHGVIIPIIVRPADNEKYEILSGHNRVEAAKAVGLEIVPAIIREGLSDDEALLIVTETNLIQRSFTDLSHSERAAALSVHNEAIKNQGKRTDLINEIENLLKNDLNTRNNADNSTYSQVANKLKTTMEKVGQGYGLSKDSVARYLRINKLIGSLKNRLDEGEFGIVPAVDISYLSDEEQDSLNTVLNNDAYRLDMKKAGLLREFSKDNKLIQTTIESILSGAATKKRNRASLPVQSIKIKGKILSKYFKPEQKPEDIEAEIIEAIEFYMAHKKRTR